MICKYNLSISVNHPSDPYGVSPATATRGGGLAVNGSELAAENIPDVLDAIRAEFEESLGQVETLLRARVLDETAKREQDAADKAAKLAERAARL